MTGNAASVPNPKSNMKVAILLAFVTLAASAPQPRKDFHEHFEDFMDLIVSEAGDQLNELVEEYRQFDEFNAAVVYMKTASFKDLVLEMESLPEFQAVVDFLVADNIDINFFLDRFDEVLNQAGTRRAVTQRASGTNLSAFIQDCIDVFPQEKLDALFKEKKDTDELFRGAIDNLYSDEWDAVFTALWETAQFQQEVATLNSNGIDIHGVLREIIAIFGQNN